MAYANFDSPFFFLFFFPSPHSMLKVRPTGALETLSDRNHVAHW